MIQAVVDYAAIAVMVIGWDVLIGLGVALTAIVLLIAYAWKDKR